MIEVHPCMARAVFDLLKDCKQKRMDADALIWLLHDAGYEQATTESVFAIPFVDTCIVGDFIETYGFCLMPGTRRPCE